MQEAKSEEFCVVDLWAAEAYVTALDAGEIALLKLLDDNIKIHNWVFDLINSHYPAEVAKAGFNYKAAKQFVHSTNYGAMPPKLAQESGLPLHICEWFWQTYHHKFPGIRLRQERIRNEVVRTRSVTSFLGRRRIFLAPYSQDVLNQAYAWPNQSAIGEITNIALTRIYHLGKHFSPWMFPSLNTHDGMAIRCYKGEREGVISRVREAFNIPLKKGNVICIVPIEIGFGPNFNDVTDKQVYRYT